MYVLGSFKLLFLVIFNYIFCQWPADPERGVQHSIIITTLTFTLDTPTLCAEVAIYSSAAKVIIEICVF